MRLLVTGGAGFIGSHFIRAWRQRHPGDTLVNLDRLTYAGVLSRLADLDGAANYRFVQGDVCDREVVDQAMHGCELVVHFAAETHVDRSITDAAPFLRTNVEGTHVLLQAAQACGVTRFLHVSTDEVYGPILQGAVDERAPLAPHSPYAASKAAGDLLVQACHKTYGVPTLIVRPTNIFGPGQLPEKLIPLCLARSWDEQPIPVYGDGKQSRNWLFVRDACDAIGQVITHGAIGEIYNIGSGHEQTNLETVRQILSLTGRSSDLIEFVADRPGHDRRYAMDDTKLRALGWQPRMSFTEGLRETIAWYREHAAWWRPLVQRLREDPYHWLNRSARPSAQQPSGALR